MRGVEEGGDGDTSVAALLSFMFQQLVEKRSVKR
jgi:hypothetical protein